MILEQFINKYNGKFVDYDGKFGFQCVDLMRKYCDEVLNVNPYKAIPANKYAKNMFNYYSTTIFQKIHNTPTNMPQEGDIVFWTTRIGVTGIAGHVGICKSANVNNMIIFHQNYPINSPCSLRKFDYKGVLGWFRKR